MSLQKQTAGIILAGGVSSRFGRPKQILKLKGKYLLEHVLNAASESKLNRLVLVLGHEHQTILHKLGDCSRYSRLRVVINQRYLEGQSRSLQAGLLAVRETCAAVMFLLGDQPMLGSGTIDYILDRFRYSGKDICVPVYHGSMGTPTIFKRAMYDRLMSIEGDIGARDIIRANPARVFHVEITDPLCFFDIDTQKDLTDLKLLMDREQPRC